MGADPELEELRDWNKYTPVPTSYRGINPSLEIGADGAGFQIELRPKPAQKAVQLVQNIKQLMTRIHRPVSVKGISIHWGVIFTLKRSPGDLSIDHCLLQYYIIPR